ncbi:MAG: hypothetical protein FLDDKLPJ_01140 [Phycisphaerae bacterium]|nr:hypothetical protein [Phycisphaerae bacterium]
MAVSAGQGTAAGVDPRGRRVLIGANVIVALLIAGALTAFAQWMGTMGGFIDMTSSSINSVSPPTQNLLKGLDANVRVTSLYFRNDAESEDQKKFRQSVDDLLSLYEASNRSKVTKDWINPLQDHEKRRAMLGRLKEKARFKEQIQGYTDAAEAFRDEIRPQLTELFTQEFSLLDQFGGGLGGGDPLLGQVRQAITTQQRNVDDLAGALDTYFSAEMPSYSGLKTELRQLYDGVHKQLEVIAQKGPEYARTRNTLSQEEADFLTGTRERYQAAMDAVSKARDAVDALERIELEDVLAELGPTNNALLVETDTDARAISFDDIWPPIPQGGGMTRAGFHQRAFKGEEKLTSAILRVTHKEQTAVVFVHFGGPPLFFGGFQGMPEAPYALLKEQLEGANFMVSDWDLKVNKEMPALDPAPTRVIFVVLKPTPPQQGQFNQPPQEPGWGEAEDEAFLAAIEKHPRALFVGGWYRGPMGSIPATYEFNAYLEQTWGFTVDTGVLLLQFHSFKPGQYMAGQDVMALQDVALGDHVIVAQLHSEPVMLPQCAPLKPGAAPEGVTQHPLVLAPKRDGLWGVRNLEEYVKQAQSGQGYFTKVDGDADGPFTVALAAEKGEAKVVAVSSPFFAEDRVALQPQVMMTAQGLTIGYPNPGNVSLFLNALHWLNDNTDYMNLGTPIQMQKLDVPSESALMAVRVLAAFGWPGIAVIAGIAVMFTRRR